MRQHPRAHRSVAGGGHQLKAIREITLVVIEANRNAAANAGVELAGIQRPLLARVAAKEELVEFAADLRDDRVLRSDERGTALGTARKFKRCLDFVEVQAVERAQRRGADRQRNEPLADSRDDAMLVGPPGGEAAEIADDLRAVRVEDVRAVAVDAYAVRVQLVVGVPRNVRTAVDDQHRRIELGCKALRDRTSGEAGSDDEIIVFHANVLAP